MATGTTHPLIAVIETILSSTQELPPWYVSLKPLIETILTYSTSSSQTPNGRSLATFLSSLTGISVDELNRTVENILDPRPRTTDPPPEVAAVYSQFLSALTRSMSPRVPQDTSTLPKMEPRDTMSSERASSPIHPSSTVEVEMVRRYPEALAAYQRAVAEEESQAPPPEKKARRE